ncbi:MAG: hypothetical protein F6K55_31555 [Moorea sp. SIO4A3]|nr:hypothetical protein [Moorena sp. SIO4A3]
MGRWADGHMDRFLSKKGVCSRSVAKGQGKIHPHLKKDGVFFFPQWR